METWHQGRYLLCRTIEEPYRVNALMSIVEDETGQIALLSLYNYAKHLKDNPDPYLPMNTILLIKEPYFKATVNDAAMIRCDSPSDVIIIDYLDENYKKFNVSRIRKWNDLCSSDDNVHKFPIPKSPLEWKARGNELYLKGLHKDSVRAYSVGLSLCNDDIEIKDILTLNRSGVYLTMGRFEDAAKDAVNVLVTMPNNVKALSRAARSYYKLRLFDLSLKYYEKLSKMDSSFAKDLSNCRQRLKEQSTGEYDWTFLYKAIDSSPTKSVLLDVADYFNNDAIEIRFISKEKGRGVIAKKDIPPGTLLVVCKAFAITSSDDVTSYSLANICFKSRRVNETSQVQLITTIIH